MTIYTKTMIGGDDVSHYVLRIRSSSSLDASATSNIQQCDITLANPGGKWDGAWDLQTHISVTLFSEEFYLEGDSVGSSIYSAQVFSGKCSTINYGYLEVNIKGDCQLKATSGALTKPSDHNGGQTTEPVFDDLCGIYNLTTGDCEFPPIKKREWLYIGDRDGRGVFDELSMWDGTETFVDESGHLIHHTPIIENVHPTLTGRMKSPESAQSSLAHFNKICVRGGSWIPADQPGAEFRSTDAIMYTTTMQDLADVFYKPPGSPISMMPQDQVSNAAAQADRNKLITAAKDASMASMDAAVAEVKKYGEIKAPDFIFPELTTTADCIKRAKNLLKLAITQKDAQVFPGVIGRAPMLRDWVYWQVPRQDGDNGWRMEKLQSGRVSERRDEVDGKGGWVTYIKVHPYASDGSGFADTTSPNVGEKIVKYTNEADNAWYFGKDGNTYHKVGGNWMTNPSSNPWEGGDTTASAGPTNWNSMPTDVQNNYDYVLLNGTAPPNQPDWGQLD